MSESYVLYSYDDGVVAVSKSDVLLEDYRLKYISSAVNPSDPEFQYILDDYPIYKVMEVTE